MKKHRFIYALISFAAIILELLPYGAVLNFAHQTEDGTIEVIRETYSYFSLIPFGYANFGCLITAVLSCVLFVTGILYIIKANSRLLKVIKVLSFISALISLTPLLFSLQYGSFVGILISLTLISEFIISMFSLKDRG